MPAARITGSHTCANCMGTPQPILPPAAMTVLIGGRPAARVGDLCTCAGPVLPWVYAIVMGSFSVMIQGLPAARVADPTAWLPKCSGRLIVFLLADTGKALG
jgi:uncharacterized Zn-binding protein involved in type VI secretion